MNVIKAVGSMNIVVAGILNYSTVVSVAGQMYGLITGLSTSDNIDVRECLTRLDLEYKLKMVESVINQKLNEYYKKHKLGDSELDADMVIVNKEIALKGNTDPVIISLYYLFELTNKIHHELDIIYKIVTAHKNSWIGMVRKLNIDVNLRRLEKLVETLDQRFHTYLLLEKKQ